MGIVYVVWKENEKNKKKKTNGGMFSEGRLDGTSAVKHLRKQKRNFTTIREGKQQWEMKHWMLSKNILQND